MRNTLCFQRRSSSELLNNMTILIQISIRPLDEIQPTFMKSFCNPNWVPSSTEKIIWNNPHVNSFFSIQVLTWIRPTKVSRTNCIDGLRIDLMSYIIFKNSTWEGCDSCFDFFNWSHFFVLWYKTDSEWADKTGIRTHVADTAMLSSSMIFLVSWISSSLRKYNHCLWRHRLWKSVKGDG